MDPMLELRLSQEPDNLAVKIVWGDEIQDTVCTDITEARKLTELLMAEQEKYKTFAMNSSIQIDMKILNLQKKYRQLADEKEAALKENEEVMKNVERLQEGFHQIMKSVSENGGIAASVLSAMISYVERMHEVWVELNLDDFLKIPRGKSIKRRMNKGMGEGYEEILRIKDEVDRVVEHMKAGIYKEEKEDSKEVSTKAANGTKQSGGVETADYELHIVDVGESNPENTAALVGESPRLLTPDKEDDMKVNPPPRTYEKRLNVNPI